MLRSRPSNSTGRGIHHLESSRVPLKRSRRKQRGGSAARARTYSRNMSPFQLTATVGGILATSVVVVIGFHALFGLMNGDGGVMIDPVVQSEYRRKQKYLRDIIDGTGGTDTEQQPQLILDNNNNDNNNNNNNSNPTDEVVLHNMHPTLLPPNSIYTLALPTLNTHDKFLSLSSLAGKIAVVINVACA
mmetsp:Transcript_5299/g.6186  ORF Transcript_5299/g.6186 Transcript_5299/m.6186 type:complete len:188 (+) Transcript_5299:140-703(+)